jgi:hypothetical protein
VRIHESFGPLPSHLPERAIAFVSGIALLGFLAFAGGRGFDVTDEGFYFLTAAHPEDVRATLGFGYFYASLLPSLGIQSIRSTRLLLLAILGVVGFLFGLALRLAYLRTRADPSAHLDPWISGFVGLHGALSYYTMTLMGPSYNYLVSVLTLGWCSCMMLGLASSGANQGRIFLGVAGLCVSALTFVKASAGLGFLLFSLVLLTLWPGERTARARRFLPFSSGAALWAAIHFTFVMPPMEIYARWTTGYTAVTVGVTGHGPQLLIPYAREVIEFCAFLATHYGPAIACVLLAKLLAESHRKTALTFNLAALAWVVQESVAGDMLLSGNEKCFICRIVLQYGSWIVVSLVALLPVRRANSLAPTLRESLLIVTLILAPVIAAVGTANRIAAIISSCLACWIFLLFMFGNRFSIAVPRLAAIWGVALCAFTTTQVVSAFVESPYRLATGILGQNVEVQLQRGGTVRVDDSTARFWRDIQDSALRCGLTPRTDVVAFFSLPGVVYALDARSPGSPWYIHGYPGSRAYAEFTLSLVDRLRLGRAWILEVDRTRSLIPDLSKFDISFPGGFELCGSAFWPHGRETVSLWKPR